MATLIDTNILLRLVQPHHPHSPNAERALNILRDRNEVLYIVSQNLVEFWAVTTRPQHENGLGFTTEQATAEMNTLKELFVLAPELPLLGDWERLVVTYRVSGKNTHDARLAAAMIVNGIDKILTFNVQDFVRYSEIVVVDPRKLA